jgi:hypothetical protein
MSLKQETVKKRSLNFDVSGCGKSAIKRESFPFLSPSASSSLA